MHIQPVILHAQNTFNNGSFMMLINLIWYFVKYVPGDSRITFWVELDGKENMQRLQQAIPLGTDAEGRVQILPLPLKITSIDNSSPLRKILRLYAKFYTHPRIFRKLGIDSVLILGGDDISEYYKKWMILSDLFRIRRYARHFPTVLAGQTIGPFKGIREKAAALCLSRALIYTRDELSFSYLKDRVRLPEERLRSSADLCFPQLPGQEHTEGILDAYGLQADQYLTLVPGGFYELYTSDRSRYIHAWVQLTKKLLETASFSTKRLVLLPHVTRPEDDRKMIRAISRELLRDRDNAGRLCIIGEELMPQQLRSILGSGYLTISSRMHAALSTFQMKKPAIALGYSVKYDGVIGRSVGLPELVIPCSAGLLRDSDRFTQEILNKISYIQEQYEALIARLQVRIPQLQVLAEDQVREICMQHFN